LLQGAFRRPERSGVEKLLKEKVFFDINLAGRLREKLFLDDFRQ